MDLQAAISFHSWLRVIVGFRAGGVPQLQTFEPTLVGFRGRLQAGCPMLTFCFFFKLAPKTINILEFRVEFQNNKYFGSVSVKQVFSTHERTQETARRARVMKCPYFEECSKTAWDKTKQCAGYGQDDIEAETQCRTVLEGHLTSSGKHWHRDKVLVHELAWADDLVIVFDEIEWKVDQNAAKDAETEGGGGGGASGSGGGGNGACGSGGRGSKRTAAGGQLRQMIEEVAYETARAMAPDAGGSGDQLDMEIRTPNRVVPWRSGGRGDSLARRGDDRTHVRVPRHALEGILDCVERVCTATDQAHTSDDECVHTHRRHAETSRPRQ